jgi:hypothetical protein
MSDPNHATIYVMEMGKTVKVRASEGDGHFVTLCYADPFNSVTPREGLRRAREDWPSAEEHASVKQWLG